MSDWTHSVYMYGEADDDLVEAGIERISKRISQIDELLARPIDEVSAAGYTHEGLQAERSRLMRRVRRLRAG